MIRLATEKDVDILDKMLSGMGQFWRKPVILEAVHDPHIMILHLDDKGEPDGFYHALSDYEKNGIAFLGPGDYLPAKTIVDPAERRKVWLKGMVEMGLAIEEEETRRRPKIDPAKCRIITTMWTGPIREYMEMTYQFEPTTSDKEDGYIEIAGGGKQYWIRRDRLDVKSKAVLSALEKP